MTRIGILTLAVLICAGQGFSAVSADNKTTTATEPSVTNGVAVWRFDWQDAERDRKVPVKIYYPKNAEKPLPVIIFSHGLGGSREGYEYLGNYWASHGYVSVHLQHLGSDDAVWKGQPPGEIMPAMRRAVLNPQNAIERPRDVSFAIDQLTKLNGEESPLKQRFDLERIGLAGHSFGAFTTLAIAGQVYVTPGGRELSAPDPRVKAAIPMSASAPINRKQLDRAYSKIAIPCFHMTGTLDDSPIGETKAADRRIPFDHINGADQFLVIFNGGDHMIFSGRPRGMGKGDKDAEFQKEICICSTVFWDAYLKDDAKSKLWLTNGAVESVLKADGTFYKKVKSAQPDSK